jgi:NEDD4-binding protein 2
MKTLIILRGLPGSGKSSFAHYMFSNNVFEADQYFYDENYNYNFDVTKLHAAHMDCQRRVEELMKISDTTQYGSEIVVSNTSTTKKEMEPYLKLAEKYGYKVVSLIVENRHGNTSVHNVPDETMEKMRNRFEIKL